MKALLSAIFLFILFIDVDAQRACKSFAYRETQLKEQPGLDKAVSEIETFTKSRIGSSITSRIESTIITIPVVVHVLYHFPVENIPMSVITEQLSRLNECFQHKNADSVKTPAAFRALAADCQIQFKLATSDPQQRSTDGVVRKYTPIISWEDDDRMKFSAETGDNAWDCKSYLNIWVCQMNQVAGYSSMPGSNAAKDGVVLSFGSFGSNSGAVYTMGKTAVHEVGHWLNLKHIWGDDFCGDDLVSDTPKQEGYTVGCPSGPHTSCNNGTNGDMFMNYMDFTDDECMNMFTEGQKQRMRSIFEPGGARNSILTSKGLDIPLIFQAPLPDEYPNWLNYNLYPNPATTQMTLDLTYDSRWLGNVVSIWNLQGQRVMQFTITANVQKINVASLAPGMYVLSAAKDGERIQQKFIKF